MRSPTEFDMQELKRLGRFLKKRPRAVLVYERQALPKLVVSWRDADNASDPETRRSTIGEIVMFGKHCIRSASHILTPIGLSSGENEYYAAVGAARGALHIQSLLED